MAFYQSKKWIPLVSALVLLLTGCGDKKSTASLHFDFSSKANSTLSSQIQHIFVNVSAPNFPAVVKEWNCEEEDCSNISIDLIPGKERLIQLLVVTEDGAASKKINYGDATANLKSGDVSLSIEVNEIGNFNDEARVTGQYIPSSAHALAGEVLTGTLTMKIAVGNGKPPMRLMESEMFAGWFNLFVLDNVGFEYVFTGSSTAGKSYFQQPLFDDLYTSGGLKISSPGLAAVTNQKVHVTSASQYMDERDGVFVSRNVESAIVGFFGATTSQILCSNEVSSNFIFDQGEGRQSLCKATDVATNSRCIDYLRRSDIVVSGPPSVNGSTEGCTSAANEVPVDLTHFPNGGQDMLSRFGPFKEVQSDSRRVIGFHFPTKAIKWTINSGVVLPSGVEVFIRTLATSFNHDQIKDLGDGVFCEKLANHGFVSKGVSAATNGSVTLSPAEYFSPDLQVALCPRKAGGGYYRTAFWQRMRDAKHFRDRNSIEIALYKDLTTPITGFGFSGTSWGTSLVPELAPVDATTANDLFVLIKNRGSNIITLSNLTGPAHDGGSLDHNPTGTPSATPSCSSQSMTLQPAGNAGDRCAIKVTIDPVAGSYNPGSTVYSAFGFEATRSGLGWPERYMVDFAAPFEKLVQHSSGATPVGFYAPPGKQAVKVVKLHNNRGGGLTWNPTIPSSVGGLTVDHTCPSPIPDSVICTVYIRLDNRYGGASQGTFPINLAVDGSGASINAVTNLTPPSVNIASPYNFGAISGSGGSPAVSLTNNSGVTMNIQSSSGISSPFSLGTDTCDTSAAIVDTSSCSFDFSVPGSYTPGFYRQIYRLPYGIENTYRTFTYGVTGGY